VDCRGISRDKFEREDEDSSTLFTIEKAISSGILIDHIKYAMTIVELRETPARLEE